MLAEQQALYEQLNQDYQDYLERQEAAAAAAAAAAEQDTGGTDHQRRRQHRRPTAAGPSRRLRHRDRASAAAIAAAKSVLGAPYVWGSARPSVGFDCSGLTSWAWAQAGVYLPHSSAVAGLPRGRRPDRIAGAAGDLLFFYSPISHVALYIGGGMMIHARHPGPGGQVQFGSVSGYGTPVVRVVRPG